MNNVICQSTQIDALSLCISLFHSFMYCKFKCVLSCVPFTYIFISQWDVKECMFFNTFLSRHILCPKVHRKWKNHKSLCPRLGNSLSQWKFLEVDHKYCSRLLPVLWVLTLRMVYEHCQTGSDESWKSTPRTGSSSRNIHCHNEYFKRGHCYSKLINRIYQ